MTLFQTVVGVVIVVVCLSAGGYLLNSSNVAVTPDNDADVNVPVSGTFAHDFGIVRFEELNGTLEHEFKLRNITDRTLVLEAVRGSCGCLATEYERTPIQPGEVRSIRAKMRIKKSGRHNEQVGVKLKGYDNPIILVMNAVVRRRLSIIIDPERILVTHEPVRVDVILTVEESSDRPLTPAVKISEPLQSLIEVSFGQWQLVHAHEAATGRPARWRSSMNLVAFENTRTTFPLQVTVHPVIDETEGFHVTIESTQ